MKITRLEARRFLIAYQNLDIPRKLQGKAGVKAFFNKVKSIQFDPLNIIGTNPNLVLQSRIQNYRPQLLYELLYKDRYLVDGWDKCMCIYERKDWGKFKRVREALYVNSPKYNNEEIKKIIPSILDMIKEQGPISSGDIKSSGKVNWFWGSARIERAALEYLFYNGDIIIDHRIGNKKYYDLVENQINIEDNLNPFSSDKEYYKWHIYRRLCSIGFLWNKAGDAWLGVKGLKGKEREDSFNTLEKEGKVISLQVDDIKNKFYISIESYPLLKDVLDSYPKAKKISFIAPLDNFIWERKMIKKLFDFEYTWEVYTPESKRKYGYYVLPVLYGSEFIARFEPRFDKKSKQLVIKNWWWEDNVRLTKVLKQAITTALKDFMKYLGAKELLWTKKILD